MIEQDLIWKNLKENHRAIWEQLKTERGLHPGEGETLDVIAERCIQQFQNELFYLETGGWSSDVLITHLHAKGEDTSEPTKYLYNRFLQSDIHCLYHLLQINSQI